MISVADLFCGAGGSSTGLVRAAEKLSMKIDLLAVNHWPVAVEYLRALGHPSPETATFTEASEFLDGRWGGKAA